MSESIEKLKEELEYLCNILKGKFVDESDIRKEQYVCYLPEGAELSIDVVNRYGKEKFIGIGTTENELIFSATMEDMDIKIAMDIANDVSYQSHDFLEEGIFKATTKARRIGFMHLKRHPREKAVGKEMVTFFVE